MKELLTRRKFLKLASLSAMALALGPSNQTDQDPNQDQLRKKLEELMPPPIVSIPIELAVDERLWTTTKNKLTAVSLNHNFSNQKDALDKSWWLASYAAWLRTQGTESSFREYLGLVQKAVQTGDHTEIAFTVGGTDKSESPYNFSTLTVDPLRGVKIVMVDGVYKGQFLGMQLDVTSGGFAQNDKDPQARLTETIYKQFGFALDGEQLVMLVRWDPSKLSGETESAQLTGSVVDALTLMAYRGPSIHNLPSLPGSPQEELAFLQKGAARFEPLLFEHDAAGNRIGILTAPEFVK